MQIRRRVVARPSRSSEHAAACSSVHVYAYYRRDSSEPEIAQALSRAYLRAAKVVFPGTTTLRDGGFWPGRREAIRREHQGWIGSHLMESTSYLGDVEFELDQQIGRDRRAAIARAMEAVVQ